MKPYYFLESTHTDPKRIKREREKAKALRKTHWWVNQLNAGICHYCGQHFEGSELTMDHVIPLARGGQSTKGNLVPSCRSCNQTKGLGTPVESLFDSLKNTEIDESKSER